MHSGRCSRTEGQAFPRLPANAHNRGSLGTLMQNRRSPVAGQEAVGHALVLTYVVKWIISEPVVAVGSRETEQENEHKETYERDDQQQQPPC